MGLGFRVKNICNQLLRHFFKCVIGVVLLFPNFSCQQNKKLEEDLGTPVTSETYQKALVEVWGDSDILRMKKDDYAFLEKNISINYGPMQKTYGKAMTITNVEDAKDSVNYSLVIQSEEIQSGNQSKLSSRERVLAVKKKLDSTQAKSLNTENDIQTTPFESFLDTLNLCSYDSVECFKLQVQDFTEKVPDEMASNGCRGFQDCKWTGKKVSFVVRVSAKDAETGEIKRQNNIISLKVVPSLPYLFKMAEYCFEGLSEYQGQKFPVKVCTQLKDAISGQ